MAQADDGEILMSFTAFNARAEAAEALSAQIAELLSAKLSASSEPARLLLSGGSTPSPAYEALAKAPLDWARVEVGLVDDRWVPETDPASNAKLVRESLLEKGAGTAHFFPMKTAHETPAEAVSALDKAYARFAEADVVVLGMGPDGHTASWFPGSSGLADAMSPDTPLCVSDIDASGCPVAGELTARMTITMPVLLAASEVFLFITGDEKRSVLEEASADLPIHQLIKARHDRMEVIWAP